MRVALKSFSYNYPLKKIVHADRKQLSSGVLRFLHIG